MIKTNNIINFFKGIQSPFSAAWNSRAGQKPDPPPEYLGLWADKWLEMESYIARANPVSGLDFRFLSMLGDSAYRINLFNTALEENLKNRGSDGQNLAGYLDFYNNLIISKVKHFFFKEIPKKNENTPFDMMTDQIFDLGQILWEPGAFENATQKPGFYMGKYCYLLGLLYAFVYDSQSDAGVFLHFEYDQEQFETLRKDLVNMLDPVRSEYDLRRFMHRVMPLLLFSHLEKQGFASEPDTGHLARAYQRFVHISHRHIVCVEPLTWHLADILNTVDGRLADNLEYKDASKQGDGQADIHQDPQPDALVGIYSSGVFLAHLVNRIRNTDLPVYLFQAFPYTTFQPERVDLALPTGTGRIVICDESVKTGFTFSILEAHLRRKKRLPDVMEIWSLFRHRDYQAIETLISPIVRPLYTIEDKSMRPDVQPEFTEQNPFSVSIWPETPEQRSVVRNYLKMNGLDQDRFDYTHIIANSRATFALAREFVRNIEADISNNGPVYLYAPSAGGRVLALTTGYLLRRRKTDVCFVNSRQTASKAAEQEKARIFLVGLTCVTRFTAEHGWRMLMDQHCDTPVDIDQIMQKLLVEDACNPASDDMDNPSNDNVETLKAEAKTLIQNHKTELETVCTFLQKPREV